jgi:hypothetical protein
MISTSLTSLLSRIQDLEKRLSAPINWRGTYVAGQTYIPNDIVYSGGITYVCIKTNFNTTPPNTTYWLVLPGADFTNPMTTIGDIIVGGVGGVPGRMPYGTSPSLFGMSTAGILGYRHLEAGDLPARLVGDLIYEWYGTADYWTGANNPALTWTTIGAWAFTNRRANSLIGINIMGNVMLYAPSMPGGGPITWAARWTVDGVGYYLGAGENAVANQNANALTGASTLWLTGLGVASHALNLQLYTQTASPVYWRGASTIYEQVHMQVVEFI